MPEDDSTARSGWTLALVCTTTFMLVLDITVVAVAIPDIQTDLHASLGQLQWVIDAYTLVLATLLLSAATLGDRVGRRPLFVVGTVLFTLGSLACGLASNGLTLDVFRAAQGIGGAVLFGIGVPLIADAYPPGKRRNLAMGAYGAMSGGAVAIGPLLGGALTDWLGWRSIFWVNVPIGVAVLLLSFGRLTEQRRRSSRRVDWAGTVTATIALFLLVLAFIQGNEYGWSSPRIVAILTGCVAAGAAFILIERRVTDPMVDLGLFRDPTYSISVLIGFVLQATLVASTTYLSLYAQNVLSFTPFGTGLRFLPFSLMAFASGALVAPLLSRVPAGWLLAGTAACTALGLELLAHLRAESAWTAMLPGFVIGGIGLGTAATILNQISVAGVDEERSGMASGVSVSMRQVGVAAGVAGLGVIYQRVISGQVHQAVDGTPLRGSAAADRLADAVAAGDGLRVLPSVPAPLRQATTQLVRAATTTGLDRIMQVGAIAAAVTAVLAVLFARRPATGADDSVRVDAVTDPADVDA
jgi:EmrB/QacA subfamily drug resistance transporter